MRVHLVYPQRAGIHIAPWTIGNNLLSWLVAEGHVVSWSDWDDVRAPQSCDLLLGHPHPEPDRAYEIAAAGAAKRIVICPVNSAPKDTAWLRKLRERGLWDHLLAIAGPEWQGEIDPAWPATRVDMAVDAAFWEPPAEVPTVWTNRVLFVGCTLPCKGTDRLARLSEIAGDRLDFCHVGPGQVGGRVRSLGIAGNGSWRSLAPLFPRIISLGRFDANPTTILEGAALGMVPFCAKGAGWGEDLVVRLPDCDTDAECEQAVRILLETPLVPRIEVARSYSWQRFLSTVAGVVNGVMAG